MTKFFKNYLTALFQRDSIIITTLVIAGFCVLGPFGTYTEMTLFERLCFWTPMSVLALAVGVLSLEIVSTAIPSRSFTERGCAMGAGFVLIFTPLAFLISENQILTQTMPMTDFTGILGIVVAFTVVSGSLFWLWTQLDERDQMQMPRLYARLPDVGDATVARIPVSDHYTVVHMSDRSTHRLLMRFADAVKEMDDAKGVCTHRSHWVAATAVQVAACVGGKDFLVMDCGQKIPVSKTYRENVVQAQLMQ